MRKKAFYFAATVLAAALFLPGCGKKRREDARAIRDRCRRTAEKYVYVTQGRREEILKAGGCDESYTAKLLFAFYDDEYERYKNGECGYGDIDSRGDLAYFCPGAWLDTDTEELVLPRDSVKNIDEKIYGGLKTTEDPYRWPGYDEKEDRWRLNTAVDFNLFPAYDTKVLSAEYDTKTGKAEVTLELLKIIYKDEPDPDPLRANRGNFVFTFDCSGDIPALESIKEAE